MTARERKETYDYYRKHTINRTEGALIILKKIKNGYVPTNADFFELTNTDPKIIEEYREFHQLSNQESDEDYISFLAKDYGLSEELVEEIIDGSHALSLKK